MDGARAKEVFGLVATNMERGTRNNVTKTAQGIMAVHKTLKCDGYRARLRRIGATAKDLSKEYRNNEEGLFPFFGVLDLRDGIRSPGSDFVSRTRPACVSMSRDAIGEEIDKVMEEQKRLVSIIGDQFILVSEQRLRRIDASAERWATLPSRGDFGDA